MLRNEEVECSVSGSLYLIFRLAKLCGIAPVKFEKHMKGYRLSICPTLCVITNVAITVLNISCIVALALEFRLELDKRTHCHSSTRSMVWIGELVLTMIYVSIVGYNAPRRTRDDMQVIASIQKINRELYRGEQCVATLERKKLTLLVFSVLTILAVICFECITFTSAFLITHKDLTTTLLYLSYYVSYILTYISVIYFIFIGFEVGIILKNFNDMLEDTSFMKLCTFSTNNVLFVAANKNDIPKLLNIPFGTIRDNDGRSKAPAETVRYHAKMYDNICDIVRLIDKNYGLYYMVMIAATLERLVTTPYNLILNLVSDRLNITLMIIQIVWTVVHVLFTIAIVEPCHKTKQEPKDVLDKDLPKDLYNDQFCIARIQRLPATFIMRGFAIIASLAGGLAIAVHRTRLLVGKMIIRCTDQSVLEELEKFSRYLTLIEVSYIPMGICTMSRCLLASIAGSVATYLVIIVQFQGHDRGEL